MAEQTAVQAAFNRQRAAMAVTGLSGPEKAVLLVLAIMANGDGKCWPPVSQICANASCGRRTAFEALDRLEKLNLIERDTRPGKGAVYTLPTEWSNWCATRTQTTKNNH